MFCILASNSPRRRELLRQMGIVFTIFSPDVDETCEGIPAGEAPAFLAEKKLEASLCALKTASGEKATAFKKADFVLSADTVIVLNGKIYGKPRNIEEAAAFLCAFSDKTHQVITAIAVYDCRSKKTTIKSVSTTVTFTKLSEAEIASYLSLGEWKDAAGAYKIQGRGARFISRIDGSYSGVVGLPVFELYEILKG